MPARRKTPARRPPRPQPPRRNRCRLLILIDQEPLLQEAAKESRKLLRSVDREREKLERFEREDLPEFERWRASEFGAALTDLREMADRLAAKDDLAAEIEDEQFMSGGSYHDAWRHVTARREAIARGEEPPEDEWADDDDFGSGPDEADGEWGKPPPVSLRESEELFRRFMYEMEGIDPDQLAPRRYADLLRAFRENVLGMNVPPPPDGRNTSAKKSKVPARLKEIYRLLVRRLHPDLRADGDAKVSALWHDVQEAHAAGDVERLEALLVLSDVSENRTGAATSLSQWRAAIRELKEALQAVRATLRRARRQPAWDFFRRKDRAIFGRAMAAQIEEERAALRGRLDELEALLANWARPPRGRKVRQAEARVSKKHRQAAFDF